jgi:hypothetical protein
MPMDPGAYSGINIRILDIVVYSIADYSAKYQIGAERTTIVLSRTIYFFYRYRCDWSAADAYTHSAIERPEENKKRSQGAT